MVTRRRFAQSDMANGPPGRPEVSKPHGPSTDSRWGELKQAWRAIGERVPELGADVSRYAAVQADRARLAISQVVTRAVTGILLMIAFGAFFATAASLLIVGIAGGVAQALDGNVWLANLITGTATLSLLSGAILVGVQVHRGNRLRRLQRRYEPDPTQHGRGQSGAEEGNRVARK